MPRAIIPMSIKVYSIKKVVNFIDNLSKIVLRAEVFSCIVRFDNQLLIVFVGMEYLKRFVQLPFKVFFNLVVLN